MLTVLYFCIHNFFPFMFYIISLYIRLYIMLDISTMILMIVIFYLYTFIKLYMFL